MGSEEGEDCVNAFIKRTNCESFFLVFDTLGMLSRLYTRTICRALQHIELQRILSFIAILVFSAIVVDALRGEQVKHQDITV